jgi:hypothetical protein
MDPIALYVRGAILLARGDVDAAVADARRAADLARMIKDAQILHPIFAFHARAECAASNMPAAEDIAAELLAAWSRDGLLHGQQESVDGAWALTELGWTDELLAAIERSPAQTLWLEGRTKVASGDFAGAAEVYAEIRSVPDEAYARLRAAGSSSSGAVDEARRTRSSGSRCLSSRSSVQTAWQAEAELLLAQSA